MSYDDDQTPAEIDPIQDGAEILLCGDPESAAQKLTTAIHHEAAKLNAHQARQSVLQREVVRYEILSGLSSSRAFYKRRLDALCRSAGNLASAPGDGVQ
jgi:hypothetical protein